MGETSYTDEELIELICRDREAGAEAVIGQYSGLIRQICARRRAEEKVGGFRWEEADGGPEGMEDLEEALRKLEPMDREIIREKYYEGLTLKEIAARLNLPYETVKKRSQRSLKKLLKMRMIGLLIAALTGCGIWTSHYFRTAEAARQKEGQYSLWEGRGS